MSTPRVARRVARAVVRRPLRHTALRAIDRLALRGAEDRPVFLGGCPRSGTTLLRTMLHAHPDLAIPRETHFLLEAFWRRDEWGDLRDPANRRKLASWIVDDHRSTRFRRLDVDVDEARERLAGAPPTLGSVVGTGFVMYAERHGAARWGDKRPMHVEELPIVFAMFPDVQFVNIVRDPRAVIASMRKLGWLDEWYDGTVVGGVGRWLHSIRCGRRAGRRYRSDQYLELRYEDLLTEPQQHLLDICRFTGLDAAHIDTMLRFHETDAEIPERQQDKYHPLLSQPLTQDAARSWTSNLSEGEIAFIEWALRGPMQTYGYEPALSGVSVPRELLWRWRARGGHSRYLLRGSPSAGPHGDVAARLTTAQRRRARYAALVGAV